MLTVFVLYAFDLVIFPVHLIFLLLHAVTKMSQLHVVYIYVANYYCSQGLTHSCFYCLHDLWCHGIDIVGSRDVEKGSKVGADCPGPEFFATML